MGANFITYSVKRNMMSASDWHQSTTGFAFFPIAVTASANITEKIDDLQHIALGHRLNDRGWGQMGDDVAESLRFCGRLGRRQALGRRVEPPRPIFGCRKSGLCLASAALVGSVRPIEQASPRLFSSLRSILSTELGTFVLQSALSNRPV